MSPQPRLTGELESLPDESTYEFELRITEVVTRRPSVNLEPELRGILAAEVAPQVKYAAFYGLSILLRREKRFGELVDLTARFASEFGDRKTLPHLRSLAVENDPSKVDEALRCARVATESLPNHPGVLNRFATAVVDHEEQRVATDHELLTEAERAIDKAIGLRSGEYAKHYATLARILALKGEYPAALEAVAAAVAREDRAVADYPLRIGEYQLIRVDVIFRERLEVLRREHADTEARLAQIEDSASQTIREIRTESVQFLGVLTAVIAFVVTGSQAALGASTFDQGGRLFLLVASAIVVMLGTFGVVTGSGWARMARSVSVIALGVLGGFIAIRGWEWLT